MAQIAVTQFGEGLHSDQELREGLALALAGKLPANLDELMNVEALAVLVAFAASEGYFFTADEARQAYKAFKETLSGE